MVATPAATTANNDGMTRLFWGGNVDEDLLRAAGILPSSGGSIGTGDHSDSLHSPSTDGEDDSGSPSHSLNSLVATSSSNTTIAWRDHFSM
ncbi:hypothetical protein HK405_001508, partial [Cladochytrium tenue]